VVSFVFVPVTVPFGLPAFMETQSGYGWEDIAASVLRAQGGSGAGFLAANRYQLASQLAFALDDPNVVELSPRRTGFDEWWDAPAHAGQSAIVLVDGRDDMEFWKTQFAMVERLSSFGIAQYGYPLATYEIWRGTDYRPKP
jgi:hypothetical protein